MIWESEILPSCIPSGREQLEVTGEVSMETRERSEEMMMARMVRRERNNISPGCHTETDTAGHMSYSCLALSSVLESQHYTERERERESVLCCVVVRITFYTPDKTINKTGNDSYSDPAKITQ